MFERITMRSDRLRTMFYAAKAIPLGAHPMNKIRLLTWAIVLAATGAFVYWKMPARPLTLEQAEQEEREIMAGTRRGRPAPAAELREERALEEAQRRQQNEAGQLVSLFKHCHDAVGRHFILTRDVTVDDGRLPPNGYPYIYTYRGERFVGLAENPPDPTYYAELVPPLSGSYVVSGTVRTDSGPGAHYQSYICKILAKPPLFFVRSVDVRAIR